MVIELEIALMADHRV
jgi:hypothetical protein